MHVHMPKPMHGWREFTGEVGIITFLRSHNPSASRPRGR